MSIVYDVVCWILSVTKGPLSQEDKSEDNFSFLVNQGGKAQEMDDRP
jgi:hypothetical protein